MLFISGHVPAMPEGFTAKGSAVKRTPCCLFYIFIFNLYIIFIYIFIYYMCIYIIFIYSIYIYYSPAISPARRPLGITQGERVCCHFHPAPVGFAVAGLDEREFNLVRKQANSIPQVKRGGLFSSPHPISLSSESLHVDAEPKGRANVLAPFSSLPVQRGQEGVRKHDADVPALPRQVLQLPGPVQLRSPVLRRVWVEQEAVGSCPSIFGSAIAVGGFAVARGTPK